MVAPVSCGECAGSWRSAVLIAAAAPFIPAGKYCLVYTVVALGYVVPRCALRVSHCVAAMMLTV